MSRTCLPRTLQGLVLSLVYAISLTFTLFSSQVLAESLPETRYPLTVTDSMGNPVILQREPQKVSSKTLFTDEILLEIYDSQRLSSLTRLAGDATFSNVADQVPPGVPLLDLSVEAILSQYPDLVFAANWSDAGKIAQLKQAGIAVYLVNTPLTVDAIQAEIRQIARMLNVSEQGEALVSDMEQRLSAVRSRHAKLAEAELVALDYNTWGTSSGADTTWHAVLQGAGLRNAVEGYTRTQFGQVSMSKELIVEINPDVLFLPGWIYGDMEASVFAEQVMKDPALQSVAAVRNGRVYQVPEPLRGTFSHHIVEAVEFVADTVSAGL